MRTMLQKLSLLQIALVVGLAGGFVFETAVDAKWSFGVMGDNQQQTSPGYTAGAITEINKQFIAKGVKFVVQMGDLVNGANGYRGTATDLVNRAALESNLYDTSIGFFPMRGNHDPYMAPNLATVITTFRTCFPQTSGTSLTFGATNFSSPALGAYGNDLTGLSYAFDFTSDSGSATFVIIDNWKTMSNIAYTVNQQQAWIDGRLSSRATEHAFVFAHQNLIGEYHADCLFGSYPNLNYDWQNAFIGSLFANSVKFFISGHEHFHNSSVITSPDKYSHVKDIIAAPAGAKLLAPQPWDWPSFKGEKAIANRQIQISQELGNIGFYIYTIDGPRVTVEYYSNETSLTEAQILAGYPFNFVKKETFGYSLNGKEFLVRQGASYSDIADNFEGTSACILSGINDCTERDADFGTIDKLGRPFTKSVTTGWSGGEEDQMYRSRILTLWGMADFGTDKTDAYTLQMSYKQGKTRHIGEGCFGIGTLDSNGNWVNAVDMNFGGAKSFIMGPWDAGYGLGTYGIDPSTKTVWAVLNHAGDFVVKNDIELVPGQD
jgi:hypothetical protein